MDGYITNGRMRKGSWSIKEITQETIDLMINKGKKSLYVRKQKDTYATNMTVKGKYP